MNPRFALLIDAGYLLAVGAKFIDVPSRSQLTCDYDGVLSVLVQRCAGHLEGRNEPATNLRTYWYDAALGNKPTDEHNMVAALPNVKLRLGRLVRRQNSTSQKGVDSRIVLDLTMLSRRASVGTIFLLAGDEDLAEGVSAAQEMGTRVSLLRIESGGSRVSRLLAREADECLDVGSDEVAHYFSPRGDPSGEAAPGPPEVVTTVVAVDGASPGSAAEGVTAPATVPAASPDGSDAELETAEVPYDVAVIAEMTGRRFGTEFALDLEAEELAELLQYRGSRPPPEMYSQLVTDAADQEIDLGEKAVREALLEGFWAGVSVIADA